MWLNDGYMKELGKWQIFSFISRGIAMAIGLVQGFIIAAVLTKNEWGIVQIAVSIGGALGIYQHLGLASASTREISSAKKDEDVFKIFVTSTIIRYCVTLPIGIGLFLLAGFISEDLYKNPEIKLPLQIYAITLIFQGVQSILNSVVSGTKRFKHLFIYQAVISLVSLLLYLPLVYFFRINGYFYAFLLFNIVASISLSFIAFRPLKGKLIFPRKSELLALVKEIFSISLAIYLMKIIYTNWEKLGTNVLGLFLEPEIVATYAFALLYAKKLTSISDSVTDVNLPVLSEKYVNNFDEYRSIFEKNFNKIFSLILFIAAFASYWAPIIIRLFLKTKYDDSFPLIPPMIFAFVFYSFLNIINSSVLIPAKMTKSMITSYISMILGTGIFFILFRGIIGVLPAMAWGMAFGAFICILIMLRDIGKHLSFIFINVDHAALLLASFSVALLCPIENIWIKLIGFIFFVPLLIWGFFESSFISKNDWNYFLRKIGKSSNNVEKRTDD